MLLFIEQLHSWISQPWHWAFSGFMIATTMFILLMLDKSFGMSANLRTMCSMMGGGKKASLFDFDWKSQRWNLTFMVGTAIGGFVGAHLLASPEPVQISQATVTTLAEMGVSTPQTIEDGQGFLPLQLFNFEALATLRGLVLIIGGGFLIGFGTRYAGGCTSGHAISGLSNLQLPSLIAVIGFFIGGLAMSFWLLPLILQL